jgi:hypothetical protein
LPTGYDVRIEAGMYDPLVVVAVMFIGMTTLLLCGAMAFSETKYRGRKPRSGRKRK